MMEIINKIPYNTEPIPIKVNNIPIPHSLDADENYRAMYPKCDKLRPVADKTCMKFPFVHNTKWNNEAYQRIIAYTAQFFKKRKCPFPSSLDYI